MAMRMIGSLGARSHSGELMACAPDCAPTTLELIVSVLLVVALTVSLCWFFSSLMGRMDTRRL